MQSEEGLRHGVRSLRQDLEPPCAVCDLTLIPKKVPRYLVVNTCSAAFTVSVGKIVKGSRDVSPEPRAGHNRSSCSESAKCCSSMRWTASMFSHGLLKACKVVGGCVAAALFRATAQPLLTLSQLHARLGYTWQKPASVSLNFFCFFGRSCELCLQFSYIS